MPSTTVIARRFRRLIGIAMLASTVGYPALAQDADLKQRQQQFTELYKRGDYIQAAALATQTLVIAEKSLGPDQMIRRVGSLPETAHELRVMAQVLKADGKSIWLRDAATETNIKHMDLSRYRTLAFATHGVMTGQLKGVGEPGLLLTPPKKGTLEDDGYLAAGEIARLKLNADWVILSACNTAASDGTPGAEGLSGMAKAFFYAGVRSHGTANHPEYAHPLFWAPFVVVGEGGRGQALRVGRANGNIPCVQPRFLTWQASHWPRFHRAPLPAWQSP